MTIDSYHQLGSNWFCLRMQQSLRAQCKILERVIAKLSDEPSFGRPLPLALAMHGTATALCLLKQELALNEAHLMMRLLIERAVTFCYSVVTEERLENHGSIHSQQAEHSAEDLVCTANRFRYADTYDSAKFEEKVAAIREHTAIPEEFFRLLVLDHYPRASAILSGTSAGAICHLGPEFQQDPSAFFAKEFSNIFFSGSLLIGHGISVVGEKFEIPEMLADSKAESQAAAQLMRSINAPTIPGVLDPEGSWLNLEDLEFSARKTLGSVLCDFEQAFSLCGDAGIQVPTLRRLPKPCFRLQLAALFLKRLLNDLRSTWLLLTQGYTAQAASVAVTLFENALTIQCVARNDQRAAQFKAELGGELPWSKSEMCKMAVEDQEGKQAKALSSNLWKSVYAQYVWLCQIKHPTIAQVVHDVCATEVGESYMVMALPNVAQQDEPVKKVLCCIVLNASIQAIKAFAEGAGVGTVGDLPESFHKKLNAANECLSNFVQANPDLRTPFGVQYTKWGQKNCPLSSGGKSHLAKAKK